jgi:hypothetical protein
VGRNRAAEAPGDVDKLDFGQARRHHQLRSEVIGAPSVCAQPPVGGSVRGFAGERNAGFDIWNCVSIF